MKKISYFSFFFVVLYWASFNAYGAVAGSCNNSAGGFCNEFNGSAYKADKVQKSCQQQGMKFLSGTCPVAERIGTCVVYQGTNSESRYRYYGNFPGYGIKPKNGVSSEAARQCGKLKGVWSVN